MIRKTLYCLALLSHIGLWAAYFHMDDAVSKWSNKIDKIEPALKECVDFTNAIKARHRQAKGIK